MSCASCVGRVERALSAVPGVIGASVNLATERAQVRRVSGVSNVDLVRAIESAGYQAKALENDRSTDDEADTPTELPVHPIPTCRRRHRSPPEDGPPMRRHAARRATSQPPTTEARPLAVSGQLHRNEGPAQSDRSPFRSNLEEVGLP